MLLMILAYLQEEGFPLARTVLQDEANMRAAAARERSTDVKAFRKAVRGPSGVPLTFPVRLPSADDTGTGCYYSRGRFW
jgi:hypothetical protein